MDLYGIQKYRGIKISYTMLREKLIAGSENWLNY